MTYGKIINYLREMKDRERRAGWTTQIGGLFSTNNLSRRHHEDALKITIEPSLILLIFEQTYVTYLSDKRENADYRFAIITLNSLINLYIFKHATIVIKKRI